jgi:hypothetical protein
MTHIVKFILLLLLLLLLCDSGRVNGIENAKYPSLL